MLNVCNASKMFYAWRYIKVFVQTGSISGRRIIINIDSHYIFSEQNVVCCEKLLQNITSFILVLLETSQTTSSVKFHNNWPRMLYIHNVVVFWLQVSLSLLLFFEQGWLEFYSYCFSQIQSSILQVNNFMKRLCKDYGKQ